MPSVIPVNYRTHAFHLCGVDLNIGAMAAPDARNPDVDGALTYLVEHEHMNVLIGLKEETFAAEAVANGLEYHHLPIVDYSQPSPKKYDSIYNIVKKAISEGQHVTIHCGAGNGRTGGALASLKLRELIETAAKSNPMLLNETPEHSVSVYVSMDKKNIPCSPFVKEAVEQLRHYRTAPDNSNNGVKSIETKIDIRALLAYERHIKRELKMELGLQLDDIENVALTATSAIVPMDSPTAMLLALNEEKAIQSLKKIKLPPPPSNKKTANPKADPFESAPFTADPFESAPFTADPFESAPFTADPFESAPFTADPFESDPFTTDPFALKSKSDVDKKTEPESTDDDSDVNDFGSPPKW